MWDLGVSETLNRLLTGRNPRVSTKNKPIAQYFGVNPAEAATVDNEKLPSLGDWLDRNHSAGGIGPIAPTTSGGGSNRGTKRTSSGGGHSSHGHSNHGRDDARKEQERRDKDLRKSLSNSFGSTIDNYKNLIGYLPGEQANATQQIGTLAGTQKQSVNDALSNAMGQYQGYRGEVADNQKKSLQDLAQNTRNAFQAGNNYLGSLGAGNSSATGMYSSALTQQANKNRADVRNQANKEYNDINTSQADTQSKAQQQIDAIDTWKASRTSELMQKYQDLKRQLSTAYAGANDAEKQAIAKMDESLFNSAIQNLNNIKAQESQYKQGVSDWTNQQNQQLGGMVNNVAQPAQNYTVGQISTQDISAMPGTTDNQDGTVTDTSGNRWKKEQDGRFSYLGQVSMQ